jgi:hypothetical protein
MADIFPSYDRDPSLPVLFLDVDGVLNCEQDFRDQNHLCQRKVKMLNALPPCDVVISSTWRLGVYSQLVSALHWMGLRKHVVGRTCSAFLLDEEKNIWSQRGDEIQHWLDGNGNPHFAIVDDDGDMLEGKCAVGKPKPSPCGQG